MALNVRILLPILVLAALSAFNVVWLSYTSVQSGETGADRANTTLEFLARSSDMAESLRAAKAELKPVVDMTRLMEVDSVWARITEHTTAIAENISWMTENTDNEGILTSLGAAKTGLDQWLVDAGILLGQSQSTEVPTLEKVARTEAALVQHFDEISNGAMTYATEQSAISLNETRSNLTRNAMLLFAGLLVVMIGSFLMSRNLSRDIGEMADRLLIMAEKKDGGETDKNVLNEVRRAVVTLEAALEERRKLERMARDAEVERLEMAEKEKLRAEQEGQRVAEEKREAEARAERQRRRAEQSAQLEEDIARVAKAAQDGDLNARLERTFDERSLNDVSRSINTFLETVESSISLAQDTQRRLACGDLSARFSGTHKGVFRALQSDINQTAEQFQDAMQQISASSQSIFEDASDISHAAKNLAERTERTASHTVETTAMVERVSEAAYHMASTANQSSALVESSIKDVTSSEASMEDAMNTIDEIANYSKQISAVVGVINDISFQTNLLALNAGVEAARAGDAGSGFAVVASEVRALAQRSSESAKEIEALIQSSGERVEKGVVVVKKTGEALKTVSSSVSEISNLVFKITEEAGAQSGEIQKIQDSLAEIDRATQSNAAMFEETTAASQSLTSSAEALSSLAGRFDNAQSLQTSEQRATA